ncbi:predicted protein [Plenodomus lingam JN3]|uniref:Predicted protein n=1 Tax=Leptosphaeria maculans (strain JN3 / isolate v23.1.3 / race Av1-4-5-6-7-8) TaxID=985895 RepID=E4ZHK4_LEPMJ|nr:predicted protein [Plenodomus lingam JN3]CBX90837.1 predicted protein [Plenodomus lingam JN3]
MNISAQEYTQNIAKSTSKSTTTTKVTTSFDLAPVSTGSPDITDLVTLMRSPSTDIAASPEREQETRTRQQDVDSHHPTTTTPWGSITEGRHYVNPPLPWDSPQQAQHIPAANTNPTTQLLNGTTTQQPPPLNPPAPNFSANTTFPSTARPIPTGLPHNPWLPRSPPTPLATSENRVSGRRACARVNCTTTANIAVQGTAAERQNGGWLCSRHEGELGMKVAGMYLDWYDSPWRIGRR